MAVNGLELRRSATVRIIIYRRSWKMMSFMAGTAIRASDKMENIFSD
ncbi:MAG: hypothetical protein NTW12_14525 [Deltaproteobacteria bacterium]|nr:hypothetical protein [Deltaproteobacteria bacterium]